MQDVKYKLKIMKRVSIESTQTLYSIGIVYLVNIILPKRYFVFIEEYTRHIHNIAYCGTLGV